MHASAYVIVGQKEICRLAADMQGLRQLCTENGTLLCFDEVMTGFRIAKGCAQEHFGITPDLTTVCLLVVPPFRIVIFEALNIRVPNSTYAVQVFTSVSLFGTGSVTCSLNKCCS